MKLFAIIFTSILGFTTLAQEFEIPKENYPFYSILEWKGMGAILMNRDPSGNMKKVNLTFVTNKTTSVWQQSFNPSEKDFSYISSENARYVYFLENLNPESGKIAIHQLNIAGNIKSTSIQLSSAVKKLGAYDLSEMKLMDVVTTDKALVHIFRLHNAKEKKYTDIATFITHHNLLVYATILGEVSELNLKNENFGFWNYIGFTDDKICFAARDFQNQKKGWTVKQFSSKGVFTEARFVEAPTDEFVAIDVIGIGANGKSILDNSPETAFATILFHDNQLYMTGITTGGADKIVKLKVLKEGKWNDLSSSTLIGETNKKKLLFGNYILNEGVVSRVGDKIIFLPYEKSIKPIQSNYSKQVNSNPSRFIIEERKELFAVSLAEGFLFFDLNQLNKPDNVKFEFTKK